MIPQHVPEFVHFALFIALGMACHYRLPKIAKCVGDVNGCRSDNRWQSADVTRYGHQQRVSATAVICAISRGVS